MRIFKVVPSILALTIILSLYVVAEAIQPIGGKFTVEYNAGIGNVGKQYVILVLAGTENLTYTADKIMYIDQVACNSDGKAVFSNFIPRILCNSTILIGGGDLASPLTFGTIVASAYPTGTITFYGTEPAIVVMKNGSTVIETVTTDAAGAYSLTKAVPNATYDLLVTKSGSLSYTLSGLKIPANLAIPTINYTVCAGDLDGTGKITINDLKILIADFNKFGVGIANVLSDIDKNSFVNISDIGYLISNFNRSNILEPAVNG